MKWSQGYLGGRVVLYECWHYGIHARTKAGRWQLKQVQRNGRTRLVKMR